jgi:hypothetical protein
MVLPEGSRSDTHDVPGSRAVMTSLSMKPPVSYVAPGSRVLSLMKSL